MGQVTRISTLSLRVARAKHGVGVALENCLTLKEHFVVGPCARGSTGNTRERSRNGIKAG